MAGPNFYDSIRLRSSQSFQWRRRVRAVAVVACSAPAVQLRSRAWLREAPDLPTAVLHAHGDRGDKKQFAHINMKQTETDTSFLEFTSRTR
ncbi:hypothetical protein E2562_008784 [Oryza meyeriana var. granulata]|uniref:Uncharacterized protein n=1 Tax=Oryza meyeriana var. granulata TaxID=110450 RepID=A0A6G1CZV6_9ORYZ|nr:hypothetical protein E2562_008784 [Oryza meyeriana var. granulata]